MELIELKELDFQKYWPHFKSGAYALYNERDVYLYNHPKFENSTCHRMDWNEQFIGDTLILFEEFPTAIVNLDRYKDYPSLYSILIHESFHAYQFIQNEKRFPNELLGVTYPLLHENIELRNQERESLYQALAASTKEESLHLLQRFISTREERKKWIGDFREYEALVETIEGPAWYVEFKAYAEKSDLPYKDVLHKYGNLLLNKYESTLHIRKSCYSSGLFLCLLLDRWAADWQEDFFTTGQSLYGYFKEKMNIKMVPLDEFTISTETKKIIRTVRHSHEKEFTHFESSAWHHLYIVGSLKLTNIDPMNILQGDGRFLHKNFLKVNIHQKDYLFQQPVIAYANQGFQPIHRLHVLLEEEPIWENGTLIIKDIGRIRGTLQKNGGIFILKIE